MPFCRRLRLLSVTPRTPGLRCLFGVNLPLAGLRRTFSTLFFSGDLVRRLGGLAFALRQRPLLRLAVAQYDFARCFLTSCRPRSMGRRAR
jgi:hypothetical protein